MITALSILASAISQPLNGAPIITTSVGAAPEQSQTTPLLAEEARLLASPTIVRFYVVKNSFSGFGITLAQFNNLPSTSQYDLVERAYFVRALSRSLMFLKDAELTAIVNQFKGGDARPIAIQFEKKYFETFGSYPDIVPTDVNDIQARILGNDVIR